MEQGPFLREEVELMNKLFLHTKDNPGFEGQGYLARMARRRGGRGRAIWLPCVAWFDTSRRYGRT